MKKLILFLFVVLVGQSFALAVIPKAKLDRQKILKDKDESIYLLVKFDVARLKDDKKRTPLNLSIVLDRSGSMSSKGKLKYAKKAANLVVDKLNSEDMLSVVEYDDRITLLWPSSPVISKNMIKTMIDSLSPRGGTNLAGGMFKGADEVKKNFSSSKINRVILLSDGLANTGLTNQVEINRIVQMYREKGIAISTMGLGLDYNEDLMQAIAEYGGGKYYYIENPDQMNSIFAQEINTLFKTVAKDVVLVFKGSSVVKNIDVFGYKSNIQNQSADIKMGNFYSEESRTVLVKIDINAKSEGKLNLGKLSFKYLDVVKNDTSGIELDIDVTVTTSKEEILASIDKDVKSEAVMAEANREHKKYMRMYEEGRKDEAKKGIRSLTKKVTSANIVLKNIILEKKIEALEMEEDEIKEAEKSTLYRSKYLKMNKSRISNSAVIGNTGIMIMQKSGDKGYNVKIIQKKLKAKGYYKGSIDGRYSKDMEKSVQKYQLDNQIKSDGVAGPKTLKSLKLY